MYGTKLSVFMNVNKETGLNFSSCLFVRALVPYSPSDVWLIRRKERRGEERRGGGWSHGWSVLLVVAAGGDANSDNQRGKEGGKSRSRLGAKNGEGLSSPCNLRRTFQRPYQAMVLHNFFLHRNVVDRLPKRYYHNEGFKI